MNATETARERKQKAMATRKSRVKLGQAVDAKGRPLARMANRNRYFGANALRGKFHFGFN